MTDTAGAPSAAPSLPYSTHHSWIRYVGPFLFCWAAGSIPSHTEAVSSPHHFENNSKSTRLIISHEYEAQEPRNQRQRRRRRRRATMEDMLDIDIKSEETTCTLNENGFYGSPTGGNIVATATYLYQISVVSGTTTSELEDLVLSELDRAFPTAVLPVFFPECNSNNAGLARRQLQSTDEARALAISMMPTDNLVLRDQITCTKSVPNTDCYVGQGGTTIIGAGFSSEAELAKLLQSALQAAVQGNALVQRLNTNLVVDVTMLDSATRQTLPPITPAPLASLVVAPAPTNIPPTGGGPNVFDFPSFRPAPTSPTATSSPTFASPSFVGNTVAPLPSPARRPIDVPEPIRPSPTASPNGLVSEPSRPSPLTFAPFTATAPGRPTKAPAPVILPPAGEPTTDGAPSPATTIPPVTSSPTGNSGNDQESREGDGNDKVEWWAWLLAAVGGGMIILCCLSIARKGRGETIGDGGFPHTNSKRINGISHEDDPETPAYEPPPSQAYVPPGMGAQRPNSAAAMSPFINLEDEDESDETPSVSENKPGGEADDVSYTEDGEGGTFEDGVDDDDDEEAEEEVFADESEYHDHDEGEETFGEEETEEEQSNPGNWGQQSYDYQ